MSIEREFVVSNNVVSVGYDEPSQTLEVEFQGGAVYQYYNVTKPIFDALMQAPSKGQFIAYQVKKFYPYTRVS